MNAPSQKARLPASDAGASAAAPSAPTLLLDAGSIEADCGFSRQTLRAWERLYGFPQTTHDAAGSRGYARDDLDRLRLIKALLDQGHAPAVLVPMPVIELRQLLGAAHGETPVVLSAVTQRLSLLRRAGPAALRADLHHSLMALGLERFIAEVAAPLNVAVGDAWVRGHLPVYEEHACTEVMQVVMRQAIAGLPVPSTDAQPRVLLSTFTGEPHALGLLMAEAMLTLEGCLCISLGAQTPAWDLAQAALAFDADIVALSFTGCMGPQQIIEGLEILRSRLPSQTELWAGGSAPVLHRRAVDGVWTPAGFAALPQRLALWRAQQSRRC